MDKKREEGGGGRPCKHGNFFHSSSSRGKRRRILDVDNETFLVVNTTFSSSSLAINRDARFAGSSALEGED